MATFGRALYITAKSIDGSATSINPGGLPCAALKNIKRRGFDTITVRFVDLEVLTAPMLQFLQSAKDCHGLRVILLVRLYDTTPTVAELWEFAYYKMRLTAAAAWASAMGAEFGLDCEWYGVFPWSAQEDAVLSIELGGLIYEKMDMARTQSGVTPACMRVVGSSRIDKTNQPYAALSDICFGKTGYAKITKGAVDGPVITPPASVYAPYINLAAKLIVPCVQAAATSNAFQPNGSTNWYHTYDVTNLPAGPLFCYVDERDIVKFLEAA